MSIIEDILQFKMDRKDLVVVDLRSPGEYLKGHIPDAINIPLLDNEERKQIGTMYKQVGKTQAVQAGLELFANKASQFLAQFEALGQQPIIVYCWRGGMRSTLVYRWLRLAGIPARVLKGGYKTFRRQALGLLDQVANHRLLVLNGPSGSGKTELIGELIEAGIPAIDLEGLAHHRGSAFGDLSQEHPVGTQQQFENDLAASYFPFREANCIVIEIEDKIGPIELSVNFRKNIVASPMLYVEKTLEARAEAIATNYGKNWSAEENLRFNERLNLLGRYLSKEQIAELRDLATKRDLRSIAEKMLVWRYDPRYKKSFLRHEKQIIARIHLQNGMNEAIAWINKYRKN